MLSVGTRGTYAVAGTRGPFFFSRLGQMCASKEGRWDDGHILHRGDVGFFWGSTLLDWTTWGQADRVEVQVWTAQGDQFERRNGEDACSRGFTSPVATGGRVVEPMIELLFS